MAAALECGANNVRAILYDVYEKLLVEGIPMPEHTDKRVAVVEAFRLHGMTEAAPDES